MTPKRIACLLIDNFPVELWLYDQPELRHLPMILTETDSPESGIIAFNKKAGQAGVLAGMTRPQADSVCPHLHIVVRQEEREMAASNQVYKILQRFSPFVEETRPGMYYLDAAGLTLLYKNEKMFAQQLLAGLRSLQYPVKVGVAANKFVAWVAAHVTAVGDSIVVPSGREKLFLKKLNIRLLPLSDDTIGSLNDLGLTTVGQLTAFPAQELSRRFGVEGAELARLVHGEDASVLQPATPKEQFIAHQVFDFPLSNQNRLLNETEQLLVPLLERLGRFSHGCSRVNLQLTFDNQTVHTLSLAVDKPTLSTNRFLRQARHALEELRRSFIGERSRGVTDMSISIPETAALLPEQLLLDQNVVNPTLSGDNLPCLAGKAVISLSQKCDAHLPEHQFHLLPLTKGQLPAKTVQTKNDTTPYGWHQFYAIRPLTGFRLLESPNEIAATIENHQPKFITLKRKRRMIAHCIGPWQLSGGWWESAFHRLYYEVQTSDNRLYLLFYDCLTSRWFLHGIFD